MATQGYTGAGTQGDGSIVLAKEHVNGIVVNEVDEKCPDMQEKRVKQGYIMSS